MNQCVALAVHNLISRAVCLIGTGQKALGMRLYTGGREWFSNVWPTENRDLEMGVCATHRGFKRKLTQFTGRYD